MAPVESMFNTIFCAVPAFIRLDPADNFRADLGDDAEVRGAFQLRIVVAGNGHGLCASTAGIFNGGDGVGSSSAGGYADDHVLLAGLAPGHVGASEFAGVLAGFHGYGQCLRATGNHVLHFAGIDAEGGAIPRRRGRRRARWFRYRRR